MLLPLLCQRPLQFNTGTESSIAETLQGRGPNTENSTDRDYRRNFPLSSTAIQAGAQKPAHSSARERSGRDLWPQEHRC